MPRILGTMRRNATNIAVGLLFGGGLMSACSTEKQGGLFQDVSVTVTGQGDGNGSVIAPDPAVGINCTITAGVTSAGCSDIFSDAGGGGVFTLEATAAQGSRFDGFSGCNSVAGNVCTLSFTASNNNPVFNVVAMFNLEGTPPPFDVVYLYNGTEISVYLVGPGENTTAGGLIAPHDERSLIISTTVGSTAMFRAYNSTSTLIASITCQVTATAWTSNTSPLVLLDATEGYHLTCSEGLVPAP